jgi:uncharacterized protein YkwD
MKTNFSFCLPLLLILFFISSCVKENVDFQPDLPNNSSGLNESLMLQLVNEQRQLGCNCGATYYPPTNALTWNDQLEAAALAHASDMSAKNYFSHTGSDGSGPGDRISEAGYNWRAYGENIARGQPTEQSVMNAWIASEGHCRSIMNPAFRELGAARINSYWVQEFGAR